MNEVLTAIAVFSSQYILILAALKACDWGKGKWPFKDSAIFLAATIGAYFAYVPTMFYFDNNAPVYAAAMVVFYITFGIGAATLWALQKWRGGSIFDTRPWFAAFVASVGFFYPLAALFIWIQLTYEAQECCGC